MIFYLMTVLAWQTYFMCHRQMTMGDIKENGMAAILGLRFEKKKSFFYQQCGDPRGKLKSHRLSCFLLIFRCDKAPL